MSQKWWVFANLQYTWSVLSALEQVRHWNEFKLMCELQDSRSVCIENESCIVYFFLADNVRREKSREGLVIEERTRNEIHTQVSFIVDGTGWLIFAKRVRQRNRCAVVCLTKIRKYCFQCDKMFVSNNVNRGNIKFFHRCPLFTLKWAQHWIIFIKCAC